MNLAILISLLHVPRRLIYNYEYFPKSSCITELFRIYEHSAAMIVHGRSGW
jgi:hypothetical protein